MPSLPALRLIVGRHDPDVSEILRWRGVLSVLHDPYFGEVRRPEVDTEEQHPKSETGHILAEAQKVLAVNRRVTDHFTLKMLRTRLPHLVLCGVQDVRPSMIVVLP